MTDSRHHFLADPPLTQESRRLFDADICDDGYVSNLTRLWAHEPSAIDGLFDLARLAARTGGLSVKQMGILIAAGASTIDDAHCSLAWGARLARETEPSVAARVLGGDDSSLDQRDRALAAWARKVAANPTATTEADIDELRAVGFTDIEIFATTVFTALRLAFSTVNNALGAVPDLELAESVPREVREAVGYGRPVATEPSGRL